MRSLFAFSAACRRVVITAAAVGVCLFGIAAREARADIIIAGAGVDEEATEFAPGVFGFYWYYSVSVGYTQEIRTGTQFTIYDFTGFIPGTADPDVDPPPGWSFLPVSTVACPAPPCDDPDPDNDLTIPDLTWEYNGDTIDSNSPPNTSNLDLGIFRAASIYGEETAVTDWFAGLAYADGDDPLVSEGTLVFNAAAAVPVPSVPEVIPEPGSMLLLASGLFGAAAMIRRRKTAPF